jgi:tetratricopeptide (TPR) repeat protein
VLVIGLTTIGLTAAIVPADGQVILQPGLGGAGSGTVPGPGYDAVFALLAEGRIERALEVAADEYGGGTRLGATRWVDSIPSAMAMGECHWELGQLREAARAYDEALLLSAAHADWLLGVRFPPAGPGAARNAERAPWGPGTRNVPPSRLADTMTLRRGGADVDRVLKQGGVLTAPADYPVRPLEIVRGVLVSLYRRGDILGGATIDSEPLDQAVRGLARRLAPPNHFSHAWIDLMLGTAYWAQGRVDQAAPLLERGLTMPGPMDHALTGWGLVLLGRIKLSAGDAVAAAKLFDEASIAAFPYADVRCLEEALRWSCAAHLAAGERRVPRVIEAASAWARGGPAGLQARLAALRACGLAETAGAEAVRQALAEVDPRLVRGEMASTRAAALAAYAAAVASLGEGRSEAFTILESSLAVARRHSPRLFQTRRLTELVMSGSGALSDRQIDLLFASLLDDPPSILVAAEPLDALAVATTLREEAFEAWILASARRGHDAMLRALEGRTRSRWLTSRPLGGRLLAAERLLAGDPAQLEPGEDALRRGVLAEAPALARTLDRSAAIRTRLEAAIQAAAAGAAPADVPGDAEDWQAYGDLLDRRLAEMSRIALGRRPPPTSFPPLLSAEEIRGRLGPGRLILSFHWTASGLVGVLESRERVALWQVRRASTILEDLRRLARGLGLFESAAPVAASRLAEAEWLAAAERLERTLFEDSRVSLAEGIEELTIVPDGLLWYLPFELLPIDSALEPAAEEGDDRPRRLLRDCCRVRYSPTRSLAVARPRPIPQRTAIGLVSGRLNRAEPAGLAAEVRDRLVDSLDRTLPLAAGPRRDDSRIASLEASLVDVLVVLDAVAPPAAGGARVQQRPAAFGLEAWAAPPVKRAACVLVPGYDSAMSFGLGQVPTRAGDDLFLPAVDLMAAGATTALLSRWSMGGMTATALLEEFLREQGHARNGPPGRPSEPSEAWRRSVDLAMREEPDPAAEPRVRQDAKAHLADAAHPIFWSGYMLLHCAGAHDEALAARPKAAN